MCSVRLAKEKFTITKDIHIKGIITKHTHTHTHIALKIYFIFIEKYTCDGPKSWIYN